MALNATQLLAGINAAGFTEAEWGSAMLYLKLNVQLGLVRAKIANVATWQAARVGEATTQHNALVAQEAALVEQINALAPAP